MASSAPKTPPTQQRNLQAPHTHDGTNRRQEKDKRGKKSKRRPTSAAKFRPGAEPRSTLRTPPAAKSAKPYPYGSRVGDPPPESKPEAPSRHRRKIEAARRAGEEGLQQELHNPFVVMGEIDPSIAILRDTRAETIPGFAIVATAFTQAKAKASTDMCRRIDGYQEFSQDDKSRIAKIVKKMLRVAELLPISNVDNIRKHMLRVACEKGRTADEIKYIARLAKDEITMVRTQMQGEALQEAYQSLENTLDGKSKLIEQKNEKKAIIKALKLGTKTAGRIQEARDGVRHLEEGAALVAHLDLNNISGAKREEILRWSQEPGGQVGDHLAHIEQLEDADTKTRAWDVLLLHRKFTNDNRPNPWVDTVESAYAHDRKYGTGVTESLKLGPVLHLEMFSQLREGVPWEVYVQLRDQLENEQRAAKSSNAVMRDLGQELEKARDLPELERTSQEIDDNTLRDKVLAVRDQANEIKAKFDELKKEADKLKRLEDDGFNINGFILQAKEAINTLGEKLKTATTQLEQVTSALSAEREKTAKHPQELSALREELDALTTQLEQSVSAEEHQRALEDQRQAFERKFQAITGQASELTEVVEQMKQALEEKIAKKEAEFLEDLRSKQEEKLRAQSLRVEAITKQMARILKALKQKDQAHALALAAAEEEKLQAVQEAIQQTEEEIQAQLSTAMETLVKTEEEKLTGKLSKLEGKYQKLVTRTEGLMGKMRSVADVSRQRGQVIKQLQSQAPEAQQAAVQAALELQKTELEAAYTEAQRKALEEQQSHHLAAMSEKEALVQQQQEVIASLQTQLTQQAPRTPAVSSSPSSSGSSARRDSRLVTGEERDSTPFRGGSSLARRDSRLVTGEERDSTPLRGGSSLARRDSRVVTDEERDSTPSRRKPQSRHAASDGQTAMHESSSLPQLRASSQT